MGNYDLEERTAKFGEEVIKLTKGLKKDKCREFWREAQELTLIFSKIAFTSSKRKAI